MCQTNEKSKVVGKHPIHMDFKDLNSNVVDSGKAHAGKYKELTTLGNAPFWYVKKIERFRDERAIIYNK